MQPTVVFVPGVFIAEPEWWWAPVAEQLGRHGVNSRAVALPSTGPKPPLGDLHDDAAEVRRIVDEIGTPVILVGHSYGGMVITEAGANHPLVRHLVYMSAMVPDGTSAVTSEFTNPADVEAFENEVAGTGWKATMGRLGLAISDGYFNKLLLHWIVGGGIKGRIAEAFVTMMAKDGYMTCGEGGTKSHILRALPDPALVEGSLKRLTRQSVICGIQRSAALAWKQLPSTFMVILNDVDVSVDRQRVHAARCTNFVEVPTNHFAHLERPDLVCELLMGVVAEVPPVQQA